MSKVKTLVAKAADLGVPALALTDHGQVSGWAELHKYAHEAGVMPIFGLEAYMADNVEIKAKQKRRHLIILAVDQEGYGNLVRLATLSAMYFYSKPLLDINLLARFNRGLVVQTACLGGWCASPFFSETGYEGCGTAELGEGAFAQLREVFGDRLYLEVQPYPSEQQKFFNEWAFQYHEREGVKIIATNDVHYVEESDAEFQRYAIMSNLMSWTRNGDGNTDQIEKYVNKPGGHYFRTRQEMLDAFGRLHGGGILRRPAFQAAMHAPWEVYMRTAGVRFDASLKIPAYHHEPAPSQP